MVSVRVFVCDAFDRGFFREYFEPYSRELGRSTYLKDEYVFLASIDGLKCVDDNFVYFSFQYDEREVVHARGRDFEYPLVHAADFWIFFTSKANYLIVSGRQANVNCLVKELFKIINKSIFKDVKYESLSLDHDVLLDVLSRDSDGISASWREGVDPDLKSTFLSGNLKSKKGEHDIFKLIGDRGGSITSVKYLSRRLGYTIAINRKKFSISSSEKGVEVKSLINYFKEFICPII